MSEICYSSGMDGRQQFIERSGVMLELAGLPRAAGRVLGALLTAPPRGHTAAELADALQASRAGISTALRQLILLGLIEHAPNPGERADRFRMRPGAWSTLNEQGHRKLDLFLNLAREGLDALPAGADPTPLHDMAEFSQVWAELLPRYLHEAAELLRERQRQRDQQATPPAGPGNPT